jgi:hypothetical protein
MSDNLMGLHGLLQGQLYLLPAKFAVLLLWAVQLSFPTKPPIHVCVPMVLYFSVQQPKRGKGDHSRPSSAEVNKGGGIHPLSLSPNGVVLNLLSTGTNYLFLFTCAACLTFCLCELRS